MQIHAPVAYENRVVCRADSADGAIAIEIGVSSKEHRASQTPIANQNRRIGAVNNAIEICIAGQHVAIKVKCPPATLSPEGNELKRLLVVKMLRGLTHLG